MHLTDSRGYIGLFGPEIDAIAQAASIPVPRQTSPFHITLISKDEIRHMPKRDVEVVLQESLKDDGQQTFIDLGLGQRGGVFFSVIWRPQGAHLRRKYGIDSKDFHITISNVDDHTVDKSVSSLVQPKHLTEEELDFIAQSLSTEKQVSASHFAMARFLASNHAARLSPSAFDRIFKSLLKSDLSDQAWQLVADCLASRKDFLPAYVRQGDLHFRDGRWKLAMLFYQRSCELVVAQEDENESGSQKKIYDHCLKNLLECAKHKEFGPLLDEEDVKWLTTGYDRCPLETSLLHQVTAPSRRLRRDLQEAMSVSSPEDMRTTESRHRLHHARFKGSQVWSSYKLPRFFSWLLPFRLAVMSTPRKQEDIETLAALNIGLVVTLTEEEPLRPEWFSSVKTRPVKNLFLPVANHKAPTIAQVETFINAVLQLPSATAALVHCGGGKGHAGTMAACYLLACGFSEQRLDYPAFSASQVIEILRTLRPGSIETRDQEEFIGRYLQHLYRNAGKEIATSLPEPETALVLDGKLDRKVSLIVCCGLPGSGKSRFSRELQETLGYTVVSQDDAGGKDACFAQMGAAVKAQQKIVVDRCNPTTESRQQFLTMAWRPQNALCVYFDYDAALCVQRADARTSHPTLKQGRAERVVYSFAKNFVAPIRKEGFSCIATVTSFKAAAQLLEALGCRNAEERELTIAKPKDIYKFPRTRHLLNFGSATRDDLIISKDDVAAFLDTRDGSVITIEEKVDGANLGISIDSETFKFKIQNRSHLINSKSHEQFKKLDKWLQDNVEQLFHILADEYGNKRLILFGEWLYAKHSIHYDQLPDIFLAFDLYNANADRFYSREKLTAILEEAGSGRNKLHQVPQIKTPATITEEWLNSTMKLPSSFYDGAVEGVYLRKEKGSFLVDRAKIVRSDFLSGDEHWTKGGVTPNKLFVRKADS